MDGSTLAMPAVVTLPGPPGAGKGPQARMPEPDFGLIQLLAADLLRAAMQAGSLVSGDSVLTILQDRVDAMAPIADIRHRPATILARVA
jgi:hypothetical protein